MEPRRGVGPPPVETQGFLVGLPSPYNPSSMEGVNHGGGQPAGGRGSVPGPAVVHAPHLTVHPGHRLGATGSFDGQRWGSTGFHGACHVSKVQSSPAAKGQFSPLLLLSGDGIFGLPILFRFGLYFPINTMKREYKHKRNQWKKIITANAM